MVAAGLTSNAVTHNDLLVFLEAAGARPSPRGAAAFKSRVPPLMLRPT
jgi:hypothetical protein